MFTISILCFFYYEDMSRYHGSYLVVSYSLFLSLIAICGILFGYPAFRALMPIVYVGGLVVITFAVLYSLIFENMDDSMFSYMYPWCLCAIETLALFIIDGFLGMHAMYYYNTFFLFSFVCFCFCFCNSSSCICFFIVYLFIRLSSN